MPLGDPVVGQPGHVTEHHTALKNFYNKFEAAVAAIAEGQTFVLRGGVLVAEAAARLIIKAGGAVQTARAGLNFGNGFVVTDDAADNQTTVEVAAHSGISTKGGEIIGTGNGAVAEMAVGPDGTVRVADSSQATGQGWVNLPGTKPQIVFAKPGALAVGLSELGYPIRNAQALAEFYAELEVAPSGQSVIIDVVNRAGASVFASAADRLIIPAGSKTDTSTAFSPAGLALAVGDRLKLNVVQVGIAAGAQEYRDVSTFTGNLVNTFNVPLPALAAEGDSLTCVIEMGAGDSTPTLTLSAGWALKRLSSGAGTPPVHHQAIVYKTTPFAPGDTALTVTMTGTTRPVVAVMVASPGTVVGDAGFIYSPAVVHQAATNTPVIPDPGTTGEAAIIWEMFGYRTAAGAIGSGVPGADFTEVADICTTRTTINVGLIVGYRIVTSATTLTAAQRTGTYAGGATYESMPGIMALKKETANSPGSGLVVMGQAI